MSLSDAQWKRFVNKYQVVRDADWVEPTLSSRLSPLVQIPLPPFPAFPWHQATGDVDMHSEQAETPDVSTPSVPEAKRGASEERVAEPVSPSSSDSESSETPYLSGREDEGEDEAVTLPTVSDTPVVMHGTSPAPSVAPAPVPRPTPPASTAPHRMEVSLQASLLDVLTSAQDRPRHTGHITTSLCAHYH
ncbi:hypothetical protein KIPB_003263 [Kipferlia bialata]|uniref:Uncharacterized protein n=1 Tax=Kipferlia bialata TaxID=797122 RepID=A0A9K3CT56_9EUKA|nr:hypothetical protein KIPB_003263 [Kipferlia bialata]|eukprot:g3263.t1